MYYSFYEIDESYYAIVSTEDAVPVSVWRFTVDGGLPIRVERVADETIELLADARNVYPDCRYYEMLDDVH